MQLKTIMNQGQTLLRQLETATGHTQHVVALIFDIRGFTNFCKGEDSFNIANFVRRVYIRVIGDFFPEATFYKPTGDGLLVIFSCLPGKESEITNNVVNRSVTLINEFPTLCKNDKLVYFKTPSNIGVGISRGSACCISSGDEVVDYSGKPLNLASRLSDMARPLGVVFDESVSSCMPAENLSKDFRCEKVFVKGLSEEEPISVYATKCTTIPSSYERKPNKFRWVSEESTITLETLSKITANTFSVILRSVPADENEIVASISFSELGGVGRKMYSIKKKAPGLSYSTQGEEHMLDFDRKRLIKGLEKRNVKPNDPLKVRVSYPVTRKS
jgi:class 3 adenylate cyclase